MSECESRHALAPIYGYLYLGFADRLPALACVDWDNAPSCNRLVPNMHRRGCFRASRSRVEAICSSSTVCLLFPCRRVCIARVSFMLGPAAIVSYFIRVHAMMFIDWICTFCHLSSSNMNLMQGVPENGRVVFDTLCC